jgi:AcrR family transcriptional regulator
MMTRPGRVPAREIRQRMLDAGRDLALEAGAALTIEHLRLEEVIQRARVPRSSAYRLWPYKEDYADDLLCYLAGAGSWFSERTVVSPETSLVVRQVITDNQELLATAGGRLALLREVVRLTAERNYRALSDSPEWRLHMALVATLGSTRTGAGRRKIAAALEAAQSRSREVMVTIFGILTTELGLRPRDPALTVEHLQLAGGLFIQSLALRNVQVQTALGEQDADAFGDPVTDGGSVTDGASVTDGDSVTDGGPVADVSSVTDGGPAPGLDAIRHVDRLLNATVPGPGLHGETAPWSLAALGYLGMVEAFVELDPDFVPPGSA